MRRQRGNEARRRANAVLRLPWPEQPGGATCGLLLVAVAEQRYRALSGFGCGGTQVASTVWRRSYRSGPLTTGDWCEHRVLS